MSLLGSRLSRSHRCLLVMLINIYVYVYTYGTRRGGGGGGGNKGGTEEGLFKAKTVEEGFIDTDKD